MYCIVYLPVAARIDSANNHKGCPENASPAPHHRCSQRNRFIHMSMDNIIIKNAAEHNLKHIDLVLPRNQLIVFTGVSGSGKSSLAFDTLFAEGQRRYVESLSAYARQFLGQMHKPDVEYIEGLSPAISIDQKSTSHNPRSTVGTVTEIYDYLRLLYARIGTPHCPQCQKPIESQSLDQMVDRILALPEGTPIYILAPVVRGRKGEYRSLLEDIAREGFTRIKIDGQIIDPQTAEPLAKHKKHDIAIVIDRLKMKPGIESRIAESLQLALQKSQGLAAVEGMDDADLQLLFSQNLACADCGLALEEISPRLFSFNSPYGACPDCHGLGVRQELVASKIVPDPTRSISQGAVRPWARNLEQGQGSYLRTLLAGLQKVLPFELDMPFEQLSEQVKQVLLHGWPSRPIQVHYQSQAKGQMQFSYQTTFEGVIPRLQRLYEASESEQTRLDIEQYMEKKPCHTCLGKRLKPVSLAVRVGELSIAAVTSLSISQFFKWLTDLALTPRQHLIAEQIFKELKARASFLLNVGLDYLSLDRTANTLSGGESQRIRLATQIGSGLVGVLYILDEPSIGLHQRDNQRLLQTLQRLRSLGNTLVVVEHDEDTIRAADYVVDIGPGAGRHGGHIVSQGRPEQIIADKNSLTGQFLSGRRGIPVPDKRQKGNGLALKIRGAHRNNLQHIDVDLPLGTFICITGVSGSGKSTLINEILAPYLHHTLLRHVPRPEGVVAIEGLEHIDKVIEIDQSPIGRTPRSNPATYTGVFTAIREIFAHSVEAKIRGYQPGRFSFNVKGGRCESCSGDGMLKIEMHFLPDVYIPCEVCKGARYNRETLAVAWKEKNIADVLNMTVEEGVEHFAHIPAIEKKLQTLADVGLGYIQLGQSATTLSGGEAQRVKLATELSKRSTGKTLYLLDEPTTGLHMADIEKLLVVLQRLVAKGNTVLVIEHNLDVLKVADYLVDLGPEGGDKGGQVVACGTPEEIVKVSQSYTGQFLKTLLPEKPLAVAGKRKR